jgi:hypothetical protein
MRYTDYCSDGWVKEIMERFLEHFPEMFEGFDVESICFITTKKKKSHKAIKLRSITYPVEAFLGKPYIVETFDMKWNTLDQKKKNLAVFHIMCAIPQGGFDAASKQYAKRIKPEIEMYLREFAASGGVPNWMENPLAKDPMERTKEDISKDSPIVEAIPEEAIKEKADGKSNRKPVTANTIASIGKKGKSKAEADSKAA